ncbi:putative odorant receptor 92a [Arctopsyche grandis]|uniref:putative odorant receptor 92a n=1 Tax=Arctopsyche grandis TaxID=121162 RepID=UPI00406D64FC
MCSHLAMLLEILQDDILNIVPEEWTYNDVVNNEALLKQKMNDIIKRHEKLILMTEGLESACSFIIALNMVTGSIIICFMGFLTTVMGLANVVKYLYSTFSTLLQVFMVTWYANLLIEKSTGLSGAAYNSRWYDCSIGFKRSMLILMIRSDRPLHVTAMKFSMISLNTFTRIASSSWSYFTLLRKIYDPE